MTKEQSQVVETTDNVIPKNDHLQALTQSTLSHNKTHTTVNPNKIISLRVNAKNLNKWTLSAGLNVNQSNGTNLT